MELIYEIMLVTLSACLKTTEDEHMKMVTIYDQKRAIQRSVIARGERMIENTKNSEATKHAREIKEQAKKKLHIM